MRAPIALLALASLASAQIDPPDAVDINPDPDVVEINLEAAETTWQFLPGVDTTVYAYNGSIPGPTIRANVGDRVIVHFTNSLPEPTTIHWHGLEIPAPMDGSHISQLVVPPGGTFDYDFNVTRDALYWYHPHVRTFDQVEKGLYGAFLVRNPTVEQNLGLDQVEEHIVVFDDILLDDDDQIVPAFSFTDPLENAIYQLNGREGNVLLLNGKQASTQQLMVANGEPQRWRCLNTANTTICRLDVNDPTDGITGQVWEIGSDAGREEERFGRITPVSVTGPTTTEHPQQALIAQMGEGVLLFPGERMDIVFTPIGSDGQSFTVYQHDWFRGRHVASYNMSGQIALGDDPMDGFYPKQPFLEMITVGPDPGNGEYDPPVILASYPPFPGDPEGKIPVTFGHGNPDPATGNVTLFAQADFTGGVMTPLPTPKIDSFNAFDVEEDEVWIWEVTNLTHGDHPFHVHGFFFELLEYEFQDDLNPGDPTVNFTFQPTRRVQKDTIRIPARLGAKGSSRTIARLKTYFESGERQIVAQGTTPTFDILGNYFSGGWLFHCHILEHSGRGMLSFYEVHDPADPFVLLGRELNGPGGKASLTARGNLSPGTDVLLDLVDARANTQVMLVIGDGFQNLPFGGGTIVPSFTELLPGTTDGTGTLTVAWSGWESFPSGTEIYVQAAISDPLGITFLPSSAPAEAGPPVSPLSSPTGTFTNLRRGDVSLSNALTFTTP